MRHKLSVIIPVYNSEKYIDRCISSIMNQSYRDLEIIIVDDGSTDNSLEICKRYSEVDNRITCIHQDNCGVSAARNNGLDHATGEYVTFVDSDDYIDEDMYESMLKIVNEYKVDVVLCDCKKEYENYSAVYTHPVREGYYDRKDLENEYFDHLIMMEDVEYPATISNWLMIIRNNNVPRYETGIKYSEDLLFGAQVLYNSNSFYYMKNHTFYHYDCTNSNSVTHLIHEDKWDNYKALYKQTKVYFADKRFDEQIEKMLLFFVYNTLNEYKNMVDGKKRAREVLNDPLVKNMFKKLKVLRLPITFKLKIVTLIYKFRIGLNLIFKN